MKIYHQHEDGTTESMSSVSKQLFDNPDLLPIYERENILNNATTEEDVKFKNTLKHFNSKNKYQLMIPYYVNKQITYKSYNIIGANHIISLQKPDFLQYTEAYKQIYINNIQTIILNANKEATNNTTYLHICSTPGKIYSGHMWLNTYYILLAIEQLKEPISQNLFIILDGSFNDIEAARISINIYNKHKDCEYRNISRNNETKTYSYEQITNKLHKNIPERQSTIEISKPKSISFKSNRLDISIYALIIIAIISIVIYNYY